MRNMCGFYRKFIFAYMNCPTLKFPTIQNGLQLLEADWAFIILVFSILITTGIIDNYASLDAPIHEDSKNLIILLK